MTSKPDQREVPCPKCGRPLYALVKVTNGDPLWRVTDGSPRVEKDDKGNFIRCPNCAARVAMEPNPEHMNAGYYVAEPPAERDAEEGA